MAEEMSGVVHLSSEEQRQLQWEDVKVAAEEGFYVPTDGDDAEAQPAAFKQADLSGDACKLTEKQRQTVLMMEESSCYERIHLKLVALSFSGASVYFYSPFRKDGTAMPASVIKVDTEECVRDEVVKTKRYGLIFGLTTPKVKDVQYSHGSDPNEPNAIMQIDLCGGVFGLPEFASGAPVQTFASVIEQELHSRERQVDVIPLINEAFVRRMRDFMMSSRSLQRVNLMSMYKIVKFVGHAILNRAKEGAKRKLKSPALAHGFENPPDVDELDPDGSIMMELAGVRKTAKEFFSEFVAHETSLKTMLDREVVCGLCHNDLHGGNLLLDAQGLVWLIDFATVKDDTHVLMDLSKFLASCLFLYLKEVSDENAVRKVMRLLIATPDATTSLPAICIEEGLIDPTIKLLVDIVTRLRHCVGIYEAGDDTPNNDGMPFVTALASWSTRMLAYSEPNLHQKARGLYCAIGCAQRLLSEVGVELGSITEEWLQAFRMMWHGQKQQRLSTGAAHVSLSSFDYELELPRFLSQVGSFEAWTADFLTREKVHVDDHCINVSVTFSGRFFPRRMVVGHMLRHMLAKLENVHTKYLPEVMSKVPNFYGRMVIIGGAGTGKSTLTKQLFSAVAQSQVIQLYGKPSDEGTITKPSDDPDADDKLYHLIPIRVPLIDWARMLEDSPDINLEPDPENDLLTCWMQTKYGQDSAPCRLLQQVRQAQMAKALGEDEGEDEDDEARSGKVSPKHAGLFLLLDGLDEASAVKSQVMGYITALLEAEPAHFMIVTTRPGTVGVAEQSRFGNLSFNPFMVENLTDQKASELAERILKRMRDSDGDVNALLQDLGQSAYQTLRRSPMVLTLLIHVLRKFSKQSRTAAEAATALKKVDVYQRALKLMLHQSDLAKFQLRNSDRDREMVARLETLKSPRARKFFQAFAWFAHCRKARAVTWEQLAESSDDVEMISIFKEAFLQDRTPMFEKVPIAGGEHLVQIAHLSFQELLAGEYSSAIVRHSQASKRTRAFMNFFTSSSSKRLDRDRLSMSWWLQVWNHTSDMLDGTNFTEWSQTLADDERAQLRVGSITYFDDLNYMRHAVRYRLAAVKKVVARQHGNLPAGHNFGALGFKFMVTAIDWGRGRVWLKELPSQCGFQSPFVFKGRPQDYVEVTDVWWPADGVATVFRHAVAEGNLRLVRSLFASKAHVGCCDNEFFSVFLTAVATNQRSCLRLLMSMKANYGAMMTINQHRENLIVGSMSRDLLEDLILFSSTYQLRHAQPVGEMRLALDGALDVHAMGQKDVNAADEQGLTPLMFAASSGHAEIVEALLARRADVHAESTEGCTAFTFAVECSPRKSDSVRCMELLIAARTDVNHRSGKTAETAHSRFIGVDNPVGNACCLFQHLDRLDVLLKSGYQVNMGNEYNVVPIFFAARYSHIEAVNKLLDAGSVFTEHTLNYDTFPDYGLYFDLKCDCSSMEAWFSRFKPMASISYDMLKILLDSGMPVSRSWANGKNKFATFRCIAGTPEVAIHGDFSSLQLLVDRGLDLNSVFAHKPDFTLMVILSAFRNPDLIFWALDNKGSMHGTGDRWRWEYTLMFVCAISGNSVNITAYHDWLRMQQAEESVTQCDEIA